MCMTPLNPSRAPLTRGEDDGSAAGHAIKVSDH